MPTIIVKKVIFWPMVYRLNCKIFSAMLGHIFPFISLIFIILTNWSRVRSHFAHHYWDKELVRAVPVYVSRARKIEDTMFFS